MIGPRSSKLSRLALQGKRQPYAGISRAAERRTSVTLGRTFRPILGAPQPAIAAETKILAMPGGFGSACVGLGNLRSGSYVCEAMLRYFLRRSRIAVLLLVFGLGMAGNALSNAVLASQMQGPRHGVTSGGTMCPSCDADEQHGMIAGNCSVTSCWTAPALPAQGMAPHSHPGIVFTPSAEVILTGIATGPEPHPPRSFLHA